MPIFNPSPGGNFTCLQETRDYGAVSGDVSYTGYGFTPTALLIIAATAGTDRTSIGGTEGTEHGCISEEADALIAPSTTNLISCGTASGQTAIYKSFDSDGFTLTWTKNGAPGAQTIYMTCLAMGG